MLQLLSVKLQKPQINLLELCVDGGQRAVRGSVASWWSLTGWLLAVAHSRTRSEEASVHMLTKVDMELLHPPNQKLLHRAASCDKRGAVLLWRIGCLSSHRSHLRSCLLLWNPYQSRSIFKICFHYLFISFSACDNFRTFFGGKYQRRSLLPSFSALFYTSANDLFPPTLIFALASF